MAIDYLQCTRSLPFLVRINLYKSDNSATDMGLSNNAAYPVVAYEDYDQPSDLGVRYGNMAWHFLGNLRLPSLNPTAADGFPVKFMDFLGFPLPCWSLLERNKWWFGCPCSTLLSFAVLDGVYPCTWRSMFSFIPEIYTRTWDYHKQNTQTYDYEGKCRL